jgi:hypothetical protein
MVLDIPPTPEQARHADAFRQVLRGHSRRVRIVLAVAMCGSFGSMMAGMAVERTSVEAVAVGWLVAQKPDAAAARRALAADPRDAQAAYVIGLRTGEAQSEFGNVTFTLAFAFIGFAAGILGMLDEETKRVLAVRPE